jgi:alpha-tubulin suppressor-like RCC1 family protein
MHDRLYVCLPFALPLVAGVVIAGCVSSPAYSCASSIQCISAAGKQGICLPSGSCAYPDPACADLGLRRSPDATPALASECVESSPAHDCIVQVATGIAFSCAVKTDGSVWCWGANDHGQLGDGGLIGEPHDVPVKVALPEGIQVTSVGCGEEHACALSVDGRVFCWGGGDSLQLGLGSADPTDHDAPVEVVFPGRTSSITYLSVGAAHNCAVEDRRLVWCWGENQHEECGQRLDMPCPGMAEASGNCENVPVPTPISRLEFAATHLISGDEFTCAVDDLNELWCWGDNSLAELGQAVDVAGGASPQQTPVPQRTGKGSFLTIDTSDGVPFVAAGDEHACVIAGGSVLCWGSNGSGQLGVGSKSASQSAPQVVGSAREVAIGCMAKHTCAIEGAVGGLSCWGNDSDGQIGVGSTKDALVPTVVPLVGVSQAALGDRHTCALINGIGLYCWGANDKGQLALPISSAVLTPTVSAATATICQ